MKDPVDEFQIYMLSKMSADDLVDAALQSYNISRELMQSSATRFAERHALKDGTAHSTYEGLLHMVAVPNRPTQGVDLSPAFRGSFSYYYRLPLWPKTLLRINKHPKGMSWGIKFVQDPLSFILPDAPDSIRPWAYAVDGVRSLYPWRMGDAWSDYDEDTYLTSATSQSLWNGTYDFGLLQKWQRDEAPQTPAKWRAPGRTELES